MVRITRARNVVEYNRIEFVIFPHAHIVNFLYTKIPTGKSRAITLAPRNQNCDNTSSDIIRPSKSKYPADISTKIYDLRNEKKNEFKAPPERRNHFRRLSTETQAAQLQNERVHIAVVGKYIS